MKPFILLIVVLVFLLGLDVAYAQDPIEVKVEGDDAAVDVQVEGNSADIDLTIEGAGTDLGIDVEGTVDVRINSDYLANQNDIAALRVHDGDEYTYQLTRRNRDNLTILSDNQETIYASMITMEELLEYTRAVQAELAARHNWQIRLLTQRIEALEKELERR